MSVVEWVSDGDGDGEGLLGDGDIEGDGDGDGNGDGDSDSDVDGDGNFSMAYLQVLSTLVSRTATRFGLSYRTRKSGAT